jgi:hypothetical protein
VNEGDFPAVVHVRMGVDFVGHAMGGPARAPGLRYAEDPDCRASDRVFGSTSDRSISIRGAASGPIRYSIEAPR